MPASSSMGVIERPNGAITMPPNTGRCFASNHPYAFANKNASMIKVKLTPEIKMPIISWLGLLEVSTLTSLSKYEKIKMALRCFVWVS